jgi:hypothetical protein
MTRNKQRVLIVGLIGLGLIIAGFFGFRSLRAIKEFRGHGPPPLSAAETQQIETDPELIRDWMTIPFVSRLYDVPPHRLFEAINIPPDDNKEKSIDQLNEEYFPQNPGYVLETVKAAVLANQAREGSPKTSATNQPPVRPIGPIPP